MEIQEWDKTFPQLRSDKEFHMIIHTHFMEFEAEIVLGAGNLHGAVGRPC